MVIKALILRSQPATGGGGQPLPSLHVSYLLIFFYILHNIAKFSLELNFFL